MVAASTHLFRLSALLLLFLSIATVAAADSHHPTHPLEHITPVESNLNMSDNPAATPYNITDLYMLNPDLIEGFFAAACGPGQVVKGVNDDGSYDCVSVNSQVTDQWVDESGDTMSGNLDMDGNDIQNVNNLPLDWDNLQNYPAGCEVGEAVRVVGDTLTCTEVATGGEVNTTGGNATEVAFFIDNETITSNENLYFDTVNYRLGIGTRNPSAPLDVAGGAAVGGLDMQGNDISNFFGGACPAGKVVNDVYANGSYDCVNVSTEATAQTLEDVLDTGNEAGPYDINMTGQNIVNVGVLDLNTKLGEGNITESLVIDSTGSVDSAAISSGIAGNQLSYSSGIIDVEEGSGSGLDADLLDGEEGSYYLDASNINAGTLGTAYYSAYQDLSDEGYLDNNDGGDLLTRTQLDGRYVELAGDTMGGDLDMDGNNLVRVGVLSLQTELGDGNISDAITINGSGTVDVGALSGTVPVGSGGTGAASASTARSNLGSAAAADCGPDQVVQNTTSGGLECVDVDADPNNELQDIQTSGDRLTLTDSSVEVYAPYANNSDQLDGVELADINWSHVAMAQAHVSKADVGLGNVENIAQSSMDGDGLTWDGTNEELDVAPGNALVLNNGLVAVDESRISHDNLTDIASDDHHTRPTAGSFLQDNSNTFDVQAGNMGWTDLAIQQTDIDVSDLGAADANLQMNGYWVSNDGDDEGVFVDTAGNVGIATSSPGELFTVAGDAQIQGDLDVWGNITNTDVQNLNVNGSILPPAGYSGVFNVGNATRQWNDADFAGTVAANTVNADTINQNGNQVIDTVNANSPVTVSESGNSATVGLNTVPIDTGGTGATTASDARSNLAAAQAADCPDGFAVQNTTTGGVECIDVDTDSTNELQDLQQSGDKLTLTDSSVEVYAPFANDSAQLGGNDPAYYRQDLGQVLDEGNTANQNIDMNNNEVQNASVVDLGDGMVVTSANGRMCLGDECL